MTLQRNKDGIVVGYADGSIKVYDGEDRLRVHTKIHNGKTLRYFVEL